MSRVVPQKLGLRTALLCPRWGPYRKDAEWLGGERRGHTAIGLAIHAYRLGWRKCPRAQQPQPREPDLRPRIQLRRRRYAGKHDGASSQLGQPLSLREGPGHTAITGFGNAPRNCIIGPPQKNVDFTLGKTFRFTERQSLQFRADFFNLLNHPSFANPSANDIQSPGTFTQITSVVGTPRLIQFSLKYSF